MRIRTRSLVVQTLATYIRTAVSVILFSVWIKGELLNLYRLDWTVVEDKIFMPFSIGIIRSNLTSKVKKNI